MMTKKRYLCLEDLLAEIDKAQTEINAAKNFDLVSVSMHNGLTLAKSIAYKLAAKGLNDRE